MQPNEIFKKFRSNLKRSRSLLARQNSLNYLGEVRKTELEAIYELSFLRVFIGFENSVVDLLKTNLMLLKGTSGRRRSLAIPSSREAAFKLLLGTNRYFSVMPIEQLEKMSKVYLKDGEPFTCLTRAQKDELAKAYAIRNHIAHRSNESANKYRKLILSTTALPRKSSVPGYYLRANQTATISYFDHHVSELGNIVRSFCENT